MCGVAKLGNADCRCPLILGLSTGPLAAVVQTWERAALDERSNREVDLSPLIGHGMSRSRASPTRAMGWPAAGRPGPGREAEKVGEEILFLALETWDHGSQS